MIGLLASIPATYLSLSEPNISYDIAPDVSESESSLLAQVSEPPSIRPLPEPELSEPEPTPLPPPEDLLEDLRSPTTQESTPEVPEEIFVEQFVIEGNTVIDNEALLEVLAPFAGRSLSLSELFQARSAIAQRYIDAGYVTSGAFIPPQALTDSTVIIQVIEGQLETINVEVDGRLSPSYVRKRLRRAVSPVLNTDNLLNALQLLQSDPLIDAISAELSAGVQPGSSILDVVVNPADSFEVTLQLDNERSPSVGSFRRGITLSEANLLGIGDGLIIGYDNTDGSNSIDASYRLPLNASGGTLTTNIGFTDSEVIEEAFNFLDIQSESRFYEFTYRQPLLRTPEQELALSLTASRRESQSEFLEDILGESIPFPSLGADEEGRTRISALRFAQEWTQQESRQVIAARSQFSLGLDAFDATINDEGPDSRFFSWRGQAQWLRLLDDDLLFLMRTDLQLAGNRLVPLEQFGLGGSRTVRGYRQNELLTDSGILFSSEVRLPVLRVEEVSGLLQIAPFVDIGHSWNVGAENPDPATLAAVGLGVLWQMDRLNARMDVGFPLVDTDTQGNSLQENGIYFTVDWRL